ncbi:MAG: DUF2752 domain-containing protein [Melioribacteraceae bacterium]|nr:DUF2752 domain-containing protein [Melioribacteraceae bacterium]MCF8265281.1 DUF2752 domain-containing protein [Melioribacteraceae bacterium]MCF8431512.1 DUF2752 domain-containing protein [Melioribacteraceae bacterium]
MIRLPFYIERMIKISLSVRLELFLWIGALIYLFSINPYSEAHLNLCFYNLVGFESCPGCGLGKSVSLLFTGEFYDSFGQHWLGLPALLLIVHRIAVLALKSIDQLYKYGVINYGKHIRNVT